MFVHMADGPDSEDILRPYDPPPLSQAERMTRRSLLHLGTAPLFASLSPLTGEQSSLANRSSDGAVGDRERAAMAAVANAFMARYGVPGMSIAIAREGSIAFERGFGVSDIETNSPTQPSHLFRIASVSKPITSVAILDLVERGRLHLAQRVFGRGAVLGNTYGRTPYGPFVEDITVEHLLTHTSGGWRNDARDPMFLHPGMNQAELISWTLDSLPLANPPGERYGYSNFGYCVLGRVIETVTGRQYAAHVQQVILDRCGAGGMRIAGNTLADRAPQEVRYYGQAGENPYGINVRRMDAHGGWVSTAADLVRFAIRVDGFATAPDVLRSETIRMMTTASGANASYAKGWSVNTRNNWWHGGSLPGTISILVRTSGGFCWAALANSRRPESDVNRALDDMVWAMVREVPAWRP